MGMKKAGSENEFLRRMFAGAKPEMFGLAFLAGVITGIIDFFSMDVAPAGMFILLFTTLLGYRLPRLAWLWAIIVGGTAPIVWLILTAFGFYPMDVFSSAATACLAIGPAIVGAYFGALTRHVRDSVAGKDGGTSKPSK